MSEIVMMSIRADKLKELVADRDKYKLLCEGLAEALRRVLHDGHKSVGERTLAAYEKGKA